jgi:predicted dinucleotide-binding enzyme
VTTIGVIGSGNIGSTVVRLAGEAGYDVVLSHSRGPETLTDLVDQIALARGRPLRPRLPSTATSSW